MFPIQVLRMKNPSVGGGSPSASFTASTTQPADQGAGGSATFTSIDFLAGTALVAVGNLSSTSDPSSVTLGGTPMTKIATTATGDRVTFWALSGVTAGSYNIVITRASAGAFRMMSGTLQNIASTTPTSTALLSYATHSSPNDATSSLTVNTGGIGVAYLIKTSAGTWGTLRGGLTLAADSPSGALKLATMTASGTPGFTHTGASVQTAILAVSFDKA